MNQKNLLLLPFCGAKDCEGNIKTDTTGENPGALADQTSRRAAPAAPLPSLLVHVGR